MEKIEWGQLLAHSHWFELRIKGKTLRLCSRCSGTLLGFLCNVMLFSTLNLHTTLNIFLFAMILCFPSIVDWLTQSWGLRQSNNGLRFVTGLLVGAGIAIISILSFSFILRLQIIVYGIFIVYLTGIIGKLYINYRHS